MKRALIVGNSDGIGLALTRRLLADGWTVTGVSRSPSVLAEERYEHHVADVTAPDYPDTLAKAVGNRAPDLCVYAAGVGEFFDVTDLATQTYTLEVNLVGLARTAEVVVPGMVAAGGGRLIGLSSLADAAASGAAPGYSASKMGMTAYLLGLRLALRRHGVVVTVVRFGFVDTKMAKAPVKPMMVSADRAAGVVQRAIRRRRAVVSYPRTASVIARGLGVAAALHVRIQR